MSEVEYYTGTLNGHRLEKGCEMNMIWFTGVSLAEFSSISGRKALDAEPEGEEIKLISFVDATIEMIPSDHRIMQKIDLFHEKWTFRVHFLRLSIDIVIPSDDSS